MLCVDEKSQIQALDRTAPLLPLRPGLPGRQTRDYKRHGTTTLFAAFNILNGKVIGNCLPRHRGQEFVKFLNQLKLDLAGLAEGAHCACRRTSVQNRLSDSCGQLLSRDVPNVAPVREAQPKEEGLLRRNEMFFLSSPAMSGRG